MCLRKLTCFIFLIFYNILLSQLSNVYDTLAIDKFGTKIELEPDLGKCEIWNNQLLAINKFRMNLYNLDSKVKLYYKNSYNAALITSAFLEEEKGNIKKAIDIYLQVLKELEKNKNNKLLGYTYTAIGATFSNEGEYEKALFYTQKAIPFAIKEADKSNIANLYNSMGYLLNKKKDYANSLIYYDKSIAFQKIRKDTSSVASSIYNKGLNYLANKDYIKAEKCFKEALILNKSIKNVSQLSMNYANLSRIENIRKNKIKELTYTLKAYDFSVKGRNLKTQLAMSQKLYSYYKSINNTTLTLKYLEKNIEINKIINKDENKNAMLKAEFKFENEKKEGQLKALSQQKKITELQNQRQKTALFGSIFLIFSILITGFLLFKRFKAKKQNEILKNKLEETEKILLAEKKAAQSELKALKSQMNPHFIFNALNGIQEQFMFGDKLVANEQMGNFTTLTRQILSVSGKKTIKMVTEIDLLTKYLDLEKMRFDSGFEYTIECSKNIDEDYDEIPPMIIQPFAENAIKHGLLHKEGDKKLSVFFDRSNDEKYILCTIIDNGIGRQKSAEINADRINKHESFSTQSISQRLDILKNEETNEELVVYEDILNEDGTVAGTKVFVKIPIVVSE